MLPICPCKDCTKRCVKCHSNCKPYLDWSNINNSYKEGENAKKYFDSYTAQNIYNRFIKRS